MKTSKKHYDYFKQRCRYYQKELGLLGWDLTFLRENIDCYASCRTKAQNRIGKITLSTKDWDDLGYVNITQRELDSLAWHEIVHLRIAELSMLGASRFVNDEELVRAEEDIANAFQVFHRAHY